MLNRIFLITLIIFCFGLSHAQTKKEQIKNLIWQVDSLKECIVLERENNMKLADTLNELVRKKEAEISNLTNERDQYNRDLGNCKSEIDDLRRHISLLQGALDSHRDSAAMLQAVLREMCEPELVFVEGGTFLMGNDRGEEDERPLHTVTVSSFYISKYLITQAQWRYLMGTNPSFIDNCDQCMVESVTWHDAQTFIQRMRLLTGKAFRLPTESEWEFAARGGNGLRDINDQKNSRHHYDDADPLQKIFVSEMRFNELGICGMLDSHGEWCSDFYGDYHRGTAINPQGPLFGEYHVFRGVNVHKRSKLEPDFIEGAPGIRLVLSTDTQDK